MVSDTRWATPATPVRPNDIRFDDTCADGFELVNQLVSCAMRAHDLTTHAHDLKRPELAPQHLHGGVQRRLVEGQPALVDGAEAADHEPDETQEVVDRAWLEEATWSSTQPGCVQWSSVMSGVIPCLRELGEHGVVEAELGLVEHAALRLHARPVHAHAERVDPELAGERDVLHVAVAKVDGGAVWLERRVGGDVAVPVGVERAALALKCGDSRRPRRSRPGSGAREPELSLNGQTPRAETDCGLSGVAPSAHLPGACCCARSRLRRAPRAHP